MFGFKLAKSEFPGSILGLSGPVPAAPANLLDNEEKDGARKASTPAARSSDPVPATAEAEPGVDPRETSRQVARDTVRMPSSRQTIALVEPDRPRAGRLRPRKYPRFSCSGGVTACIRGSSYKLWGELCVIGRGGCYVATIAPFAPQTELDLLIGAHGVELRVQGRVTCCDRPSGMGVMFTRMNEINSEHLQRLLTIASTPQLKTPC
jgi:hypothetical protein